MYNMYEKSSQFGNPFFLTCYASVHYSMIWLTLQLVVHISMESNADMREMSLDQVTEGKITQHLLDRVICTDCIRIISMFYRHFCSHSEGIIGQLTGLDETGSNTALKGEARTCSRQGNGKIPKS